MISCLSNNILPEKLYRASQVREMERIVIDQHGVSGIELMRNAGLAVFELIKQYFSSKVITVFCGAGNNAGDGYVVAELALHAGIKVEVYYLSNPEGLKGDALLAYQSYIKSGGKVEQFDGNCELNDCVIVDALLGTGLNRHVSGEYAQAIRLINQSHCKIISVDIPSGLNADTGNIMGLAVQADHTVSFIALKQGMFTGFAADCCGDISFSSLNISEDVYQCFDYASWHLQAVSLPKRKRSAHKGDCGHVLVVGGDEGYSGAIKLAAEAALKTGAGLVSVATHVNHAGLINSRRPELMCHGISGPADLSTLIEKATVVVIGPGLGQGLWGKALFKTVLACDKPIVIDADALNLLALQVVNKDNWVLTPHPGECSRLLACTTVAIAKDRFAAVTALHNKYGGIAILKGAGTLIKNADETVVSTTGNPGMASGGMGDVLAGMIGGLIAQKMSLYHAAKTAVYIHGKAADLSVEKDGEIGLLASDLMPFIRKLVNA